MTRLHRQGQFWHQTVIGENGGLKGAGVAQDEVDTWTVHLFLQLDVNHTTIDSHEAVYSVMGGVYARYELQIDGILVRSTYRPNLAVARSYSGPKRHVFLAGDSAHQNIAFGGYGMNMGIGDAFDIGWKLAAVIKGYGKQGLLASFQQKDGLLLFSAWRGLVPLERPYVSEWDYRWCGERYRFRLRERRAAESTNP